MTNTNPMRTILPVPVRFAEGSRSDVASLIRHHYRTCMPATACGIRTAATCEGRSRRWRVVGVAVLSWPVPMLAARNRHFNLRGYGTCIRFANQNVRTISRVIVHPQFRAAGIAQELVGQLIRGCPTRYVESSTSMGAFAGFLIRCGFQSIAAPASEPAYFLLDREAVGSNRSESVQTPS